MSDDAAVQRGEILALKISVRALMQALYEADPNAASKARSRVNKEVLKLTSNDERKAALGLCTNYLFVPD